MDGWRKKIEDREKKGTLHKTREQKKDPFRVKYDSEQPLKLFIHKLKFRCYVCGKPSSGPEAKVGGASQSAFMDGRLRGYYWNIPRDLTRCIRCERWACKEHIHHGVCKNCAKRL